MTCALYDGRTLNRIWLGECPEENGRVALPPDARKILYDHPGPVLLVAQLPVPPLAVVAVK